MTIEQGGREGAPANSVIYSFKSRWLESIQSGQIGVFFRKRGPAKRPKRIFIYAGSPISSIIAFADVAQMKDVDLDRSLELANLGKISNDELNSYVGSDGNVKAIFLTNHQMLQRSLGINELRKIFNFHPPQNFMQISSEVEKKILEASNEKETY